MAPVPWGHHQKSRAMQGRLLPQGRTPHQHTVGTLPAHQCINKQSVLAICIFMLEYPDVLAPFVITHSIIMTFVKSGPINIFNGERGREADLEGKLCKANIAPVKVRAQS